MLKKGLSKGILPPIVVTGMAILVIVGSVIYSYISAVLIYSFSNSNLEISELPLFSPMSHFDSGNHVQYGVWAFSGFIYWVAFLHGLKNWPIFKRRATIYFGKIEFSGHNGIAAWLLMYGFFVLAQNFIFSFIPGFNMDDGLAAPELSSSHWIRVGIFYFSVVLFYPFVEELVFRGFLYDGIRRLSGAAPAVLLSSALFAVLHVGTYGIAPVALSVLFLDALFWGYCRVQTGGITCPFILHAFTNLSAT